MEENPILENNSDLPVISGRNDDEHWILGLFYYNKEDPAVFIEDRFGANIGFNFASFGAQIAVVVIAVGTIALYVGVTMMFV